MHSSNLFLRRGGHRQSSKAGQRGSALTPNPPCSAASKKEQNRDSHATYPNHNPLVGATSCQEFQKTEQQHEQECWDEFDETVTERQDQRRPWMSKIQASKEKTGGVGKKKNSCAGGGVKWKLYGKRFLLRLLAMKRRVVENMGQKKKIDWVTYMMGCWLLFLFMYAWQGNIGRTRQQKQYPVDGIHGTLFHRGIPLGSLDRYYDKCHYSSSWSCFKSFLLGGPPCHRITPSNRHFRRQIQWNYNGATSSIHGHSRREGLRPLLVHHPHDPESMRVYAPQPRRHDVHHDDDHRHHHDRHHGSHEHDKEDEQEEEIWDDEWYDEDFRRPFEPYEDMPQCEPMHSWQTSQRPNCNLVHEQRLDDATNCKFLASGHFRQTFQIPDTSGTNPRDHYVAMKTLKSSHEFNANLMESHRVDAVIYERTTASRWIMDIYGYCGYSGLFEYASGGNMADHVLDRQENGREPLTRLEKLSLAIQATSAVAALHSTDSIEGYSAMMHTDLFLNQFVWSGNLYKLNDFNRGHLLWWNDEKRENCPYVSNRGNAGNARIRSPEELNGDWQTEKSDVFSLGYVIYSILTENIPFKEYDPKEVHGMIRAGHLPSLGLEILQSNHSIDKALVEAMNMCFEFNWRKRARASEVLDFLMEQTKRVRHHEG